MHALVSYHHLGEHQMKLILTAALFFALGVYVGRPPQIVIQTQTPASSETTQESPEVVQIVPSAPTPKESKRPEESVPAAKDEPPVVSDEPYRMSDSEAATWALDSAAATKRSISYGIQQSRLTLDGDQYRHVDLLKAELSSLGLVVVEEGQQGLQSDDSYFVLVEAK
jgi:hypothetical protein